MLPPDASGAASDYAWSVVDTATGQWSDELDESLAVGAVDIVQPFALCVLYEPAHYKDEKKLIDAIGWSREKEKVQNSHWGVVSACWRIRWTRNIASIELTCSE